MIEIVPIKPEHVREIVQRNIDERLAHGLHIHSVVPLEDAIKAYLSPGSIGVSGLLDHRPIACAGIINLGWNRGEAWLMPSTLFFKHFKSCYVLVKEGFVSMAKQRGFKRVQAVTDRSDLDNWFKHLGFEKEGTLRAYSPENRDARMYSRVF